MQSISQNLCIPPSTEYLIIGKRGNFYNKDRLHLVQYWKDDLLQLNCNLLFLEWRLHGMYQSQVKFQINKLHQTCEWISKNSLFLKREREFNIIMLRKFWEHSVTGSHLGGRKGVIKMQTHPNRGRKVESCHQERLHIVFFN